MRRAALGFRVHSGWTALVALAFEKGAPVVLARERVHLVETFTYEFRQPYHTGAKLPLDEARTFVARMRDESRRLALRAIRKLAADLLAQGYKLSGCGLLLSSGRPLPKLSQILASHSLIHSADGELFREALLHAAARCSLKSVTVKEREVLDSAARALRVKPADLARRVSELGRAVGSPWTQDEKLATMAAWLALGSK
jgi:hypothetical protein